MIKKLLFVTLAFIATMVAQNQAEAQIVTRWGTTAGANLNEIHFKQTDIFSSKRRFGAIIGATGEAIIPGAGFALDASLLYNYKHGLVGLGEKKAWSSLGYGNEDVQMHALNIPLHLKFKFQKLGGLEDTFMPLIFVGPSFNFLLAGKPEQVLDYKMFTVSLQFGIGFEFQRHLQLQLGYSFETGQNLKTHLLENHSAKNRTFYSTLTYYFKSGN